MIAPAHARNETSNMKYGKKMWSTYEHLWPYGCCITSTMNQLSQLVDQLNFK